jgi:hypothetical protein
VEELSSFSDDFNRSNGALGKPWLCNSGWAVSSNQAINIPISLSGELLTDPGIESWDDASTPHTPWTHTHAGSSTVNRDGADQHGGTYCCRMDLDATPGTTSLMQAISHTLGKIIQLTGWIKVSNAAAIPKFYMFHDAIQNCTWVDASITTYRNIQCVCLPNQANDSLILTNTSSCASKSIFGDDFSCKSLDFGDSLALIKYASNNMNVLAKPTCLNLNYIICGVAGWVDVPPPGNPNYGLIVVHTGQKIHLVKYVNGVWTDLISANDSTTGNSIQMICSGNSVSIWHDGVQVGTTQTVTDVPPSPYFGLFSPHLSASLDNFVCVPS